RRALDAAAVGAAEPGLDRHFVKAHGVRGAEQHQRQQQRHAKNDDERLVHLDSLLIIDAASSNGLVSCRSICTLMREGSTPMMYLCKCGKTFLYTSMICRWRYNSGAA